MEKTYKERFVIKSHLNNRGRDIPVAKAPAQ